MASVCNQCLRNASLGLFHKTSDLEAGTIESLTDLDVSEASFRVRRPNTEEDDLSGIMRRKRLELVPMSEDEALDQMELLDHDFFVFCNANTGQVNVLYRRENGGFGILEPHVA